MKKYPKIVGICAYCKCDIVAKNSSFDKPNRKFCSISCGTAWKNANIPQSENQRMLSAERARRNFTGKPKSLRMRRKLSLANSGIGHWNWQGGKTPETHKSRGDFKLRYWSRLVLSRDNHTCQKCHVTEGRIDAHHIKPLNDNPKLKYELSNGIALCRSCHAKEDTQRRIDAQRLKGWPAKPLFRDENKSS